MKLFQIFLLVAILSLSACTKQTTNEEFKTSLTPQEEQRLRELEEKDYDLMSDKDKALIDKAEAEVNKSIKEEEERASKKLQDDVNLAVELDELKDKKSDGSAARGSCNAVSAASTCIEYIGSIWSDQQMRLNCEGSGIFSKSPCPEGMKGGCNIGEGIPSDMVTWFYLEGDGEITEASLKNAKGACENTPLSKWLIHR